MTSFDVEPEPPELREVQSLESFQSRLREHLVAHGWRPKRIAFTAATVDVADDKQEHAEGGTSW